MPLFRICPERMKTRADSCVLADGRLLRVRLTLPIGTQVDHPRGLATSGVNQAAAADVKKFR